MESKAEPKKPGLLDLPDKCLLHIFSFIPPQHMDDIIEMCPRWDRLVQNNIPVEVHLTDIGFRIAMHYFIGHEQLPKYRVKIAHSRMIGEDLPELKSPEDLEIVDFPTQTSLKTFKSLVSKATNLKELHFGYSSLSYQNLTGLDLPTLKVLNICDREINPKPSSTLSANISGFLKKSLPSIQSLSITTTAPRRQIADYTKDLLYFIQNNFRTIKKIYFQITPPLKAFSAPDDCGPLADEHPIQEEFDHQKLSLTKLDELELNFGNNFFVGLEHWTKLLEGQMSLSHLAIGLEKPLNPSIFIAPVTNSADTLVTLQLGIDIFDENQNSPQQTMDCSIFKDCKQLKMLILKGPTSAAAGARSPSMELTNLGTLPKSLTCLAIEDLYLESKQISEITKGLMLKGQRLEKICLRNIGTQPNFGVTVETLEGWIMTIAFLEIIVKGVNAEGNSQLQDYENLKQFGLKSPIEKCEFHAVYYPKFLEYRLPTKEEAPKKFTFE